MSELTGSNQRCRAQFKCVQTVLGQRSAGNGPNGLSYYYYYYCYIQIWTYIFLLIGILDISSLFVLFYLCVRSWCCSVLHGPFNDGDCVHSLCRVLDVLLLMVLFPAAVLPAWSCHKNSCYCTTLLADIFTLYGLKRNTIITLNIAQLCQNKCNKIIECESCTSRSKIVSTAQHQVANLYRGRSSFPREIKST